MHEDPSKPAAPAVEGQKHRVFSNTEAIATPVIEQRNASNTTSSSAVTRPRTPNHIESTAMPLLTSTKSVKTVVSWPTAPKTIRKSLLLVVWDSMFDIFLFTCAVAFLTFALIVVRYDQTPTADHPLATKRLQSAIKYSPTVFPILFALIMGKATHSMLLWRLEYGEKIGVLDILASSTSFTSTMVSQFQLRTVSVFGLSLLAMWALSPVGGQASLRQMTIGTKTQSQPATFDYMVHNGYGYAYQFAGRLQPVGYLNTIFNGAILAPAASRSTPQDLWGNVKIPRIEHYEEHATADSDGWFDTTTSDPSTYTSLIGIPMSGTNSTDFVDYKTRIHTAYFCVTCSLTLDKNYFDLKGFNTTFQDFAGSGAHILAQYNRSRVQIPKLEPFRFIYATMAAMNDTDYILDCNVTGSYVETEIKCPRSSSCMASRVRRSGLDHFPPNWTFLDANWQNLILAFDDFVNSSPGKLRSATLLDRYLSNPDLVITEANMNYVIRTSEHNYSLRMGQLLNSYFTAVNALYAITGGINNNTAYFWDAKQSFIPEKRNREISEYGPFWNGTDITDAYNFTGEGSRRAKVWAAEGIKSTSAEIIIAHKSWVVTLCIASIVLIFASLVSPLVHFFLIKGPEVMMNISSLATRGNPHIPLPDGGTFLEASDRARLLKTVRIRHGDLEDKANVGNLVIGSLDVDNLNIVKVKHGRLYE